MTTEKKKTKYAKIKILNVILYPDENQKPEKYIELFQKIFNEKVTVNTYGDKGTRFRTMFSKPRENPMILYGSMSNSFYVDPKKEALDNETNKLVPSNIDKNISFIPTDWDYFFFAEYHRFVFFSSASESQITKFLNTAFGQFYEESEYSINVETDRNTIEEILKYASYAKLEATLNYSNNANTKGWAGLLDKEARKSRAKQIGYKFVGDKKNPLQIEENSMTEGIIELAKSHGRAKVSAYTEKGNVKIIDTEEHPLEEQIKYTDESIIDVISRLLKELFGNNEE